MIKSRVILLIIRSLLLTSFVLLSVGFSCSQQLPQYSQFGINRFIVNPAVAGTEDVTYIQSSYRMQWAGLQGAPQSGYISAYSPVGKTNIGQSYARGRQKGSWLSLGGVFAYDKLGPIKQTSAHATLAYNLPLSKHGLRVSFGMNLGLKQFAYDPKGYTDYIVDINDVFVFNSYSKINPDGSLGIWVYDKYFFAGVSAFQLFANEIGFDPVAIGKNVRHYYGMIGCKLEANEDVYFVPAILLKNVSKTAFSVDVNGKMYIKENYWLGLNYRYGDSFSGFLGLSIKNVELSYSYDYITSSLSKHTSGSHEILLGYQIKKGKRLVSPSDFW